MPPLLSAVAAVLFYPKVTNTAVAPLETLGDTCGTIREVPEIRVDTIGDLAPGCSIYAFCDACQHSAKLNLTRLKLKYGPGLLLDNVKRCVTCSRGGRRTAEIWLVNSAK
jgi:hypothetical protein